MDLPILANYLQFTEANWKYQTQPSKRYCQAMNDYRCNWPRGKVMGGSSVLNYMIFSRGHKKDYDNWEKLGNVGWSYKDILPYYMKLENYTVKGFENSPLHNSDGYLSVTSIPYRTKLADAVVDSAKEYGFDYVDYNGANQIGVSNLQVTMLDGIRASSSRSYLHPIAHRPNLHIKKNAMVSRILINAKTKQAYGVEFVQNTITSRVLASKEVIVSAGAINSPQLLMLSGIGPKNDLNRVGIPVIENLKVGHNLMDHVAAGGLTFTIEEPYSVKTIDFLQPKPFFSFFANHKGPMTLPGGCEVVLFSDLQNPNSSDAQPDMELLYQAGSMTSDPLLRKNFGITDKIYNSVFAPIEDRDAFMVLPMLLRPRSKGRITLQDDNYLSKPLIYPNYYAYQEDIDTLVGGIKLAIDIANQQSLQSIGTSLHRIPIPDCKKFKFGSDKYWECFIRHFTFTIYHQSGTCKMGPTWDKNAVVDPRLRVYGIKGLRVIDASIMPEIPAAHTNGPVYMIAEKGSDLIKEDWRTH